MASAGPTEDLIEDDLPRSATVTAMAWNWDGSAIAVASESGSKARIGIWAPDGTAMHRFDVQGAARHQAALEPQRRLHPRHRPRQRRHLATVFSALTCNTMSHFLPNHDLNTDPLDAAWISESEFLLCGGDLLMSMRCSDDAIVPTATSTPAATTASCRCSSTGARTWWPRPARRHDRCELSVCVRVCVCACVCQFCVRVCVC